MDYSVDIENFRPASDPFGYTITDSATTLDHLNMGVGVWWSMTSDPLVLFHDGARVLGPIDGKDGVVNQRNSLDLQVGIGITRYFRCLFDVPVVLWQEGFRPEQVPLEEVDIQSSGVSDLRIAPKIVFLRTGEDSPVGVAVVPRLMIPTSVDGTFIGEGSVTFQPMFIAEIADGSVRKGEYHVRFAVNLGATFETSINFNDLTLNDAFVYRAALGLRPTSALEVGFETAGWVAGSEETRSPVEVIPWLKVHPAKKVSLTAGAGFGLNPGIGNPDYRVFFGATLSPSINPEELDKDHDGVPNKYDQCPYEMEDIDGFRDDDGCPDYDNDGDGLLDFKMRIMEPETVNGLFG